MTTHMPETTAVIQIKSQVDSYWGDWIKNEDRWIDTFLALYSRYVVTRARLIPIKIIYIPVEYM